MKVDLIKMLILKLEDDNYVLTKSEKEVLAKILSDNVLNKLTWRQEWLNNSNTKKIMSLRSNISYHKKKLIKLEEQKSTETNEICKYFIIDSINKVRNNLKKLEKELQEETKKSKGNV